MFTAIYVPDFHLQAVLRHEPELYSRAVALIDEHSPKAKILQMTDTARAAGVHEGMTSTQAMARCSELVIKPRSPACEAAANTVLLQCASAFSPCIEATGDGIVTLDLKGNASLRARVLPSCHAERSLRSEASLNILRCLGHAASIQSENRPFDSAEDGSAQGDKPEGVLCEGAPLLDQLARHLLAQLAPFHFRAQAGIAETPDLALLAARCAAPVLVVTNSREFLSSLPVDALAPDPDSKQWPVWMEIFSVLQKWGIHTLGALTVLDKNQLGERLGPEVLELWDRAAGRSTRLLKLIPPPETFEESTEFEMPVEILEPLLFMLRRFLDQIALRLGAAWLVARELTLGLDFDNDRKFQRVFVIPSPTRDVDVLFRMLHTQLENFRADSPIVALHLSAGPCAPHSDQFGLFDNALRDPNRFYETLARLHALVGNNRVGTPVVELTHRPDAFRMEPVNFAVREKISNFKFQISNFPGLPLRRFRPPVSAQITLRDDRPVFIHTAGLITGIVRAAGPWRSSGDWWDTQRWQRDEWDIETSEQGVYRIYQHDGQWFLEGVYD